MTIDEIKSRIVKSGNCFYAGVSKYFVYICKEDILYGTGDYEDFPELAEDQDRACYTVYYSNLLDPYNINASAGQYISYEKAVEAVESSEGFQKWEVIPYGQSY